MQHVSNCLDHKKHSFVMARKIYCPLDHFGMKGQMKIHHCTYPGIDQYFKY